MNYSHLLKIRIFRKKIFWTSRPKGFQINKYFFNILKISKQSYKHDKLDSGGVLHHGTNYSHCYRSSPRFTR